MLPDLKQTDRFSEAEKALMKKAFKESPAIYALRNAFYQLELSEVEEKMLEFDEETLKVLKKLFLPSLAEDVPVGMQADSTYDPLLDQIDLMSPASALLRIEANDLRVREVVGVETSTGSADAMLAEKGVEVGTNIIREASNFGDIAAWFFLGALTGLLIFVLWSWYANSNGMKGGLG